MTQALHTLLEHAERQRNEALALLLKAEEAARRLQQQGLQLLAYRDDYRQRQPGLGGHSVSIELLRSHHEFMQRLEQALTQQAGQMTVAETRLTARRAELLALETRVASVRKLLERRSHDLRRRNDRQEQRRSDDAAQHAGRHEGPLSAAWSGGTEALPLNHH
jgi:flagellar FliJ protein